MAVLQHKSGLRPSETLPPHQILNSGSTVIEKGICYDYLNFGLCTKHRCPFSHHPSNKPLPPRGPKNSFPPGPRHQNVHNGNSCYGGFQGRHQPPIHDQSLPHYGNPNRRFCSPQQPWGREYWRREHQQTWRPEYQQPPVSRWSSRYDSRKPVAAGIEHNRHPLRNSPDTPLLPQTQQLNHASEPFMIQFEEVEETIRLLASQPQNSSNSSNSSILLDSAPGQAENPIPLNSDNLVSSPSEREEISFHTLHQDQLSSPKSPTPQSAIIISVPPESPPDLIPAEERPAVLSADFTALSTPLIEDLACGVSELCEDTPSPSPRREAEVTQAAVATSEPIEINLDCETKWHGSDIEKSDKQELHTIETEGRDMVGPLDDTESRDSRPIPPHRRKGFMALSIVSPAAESEVQLKSQGAEVSPSSYTSKPHNSDIPNQLEVLSDKQPQTPALTLPVKSPKISKATPDFPRPGEKCPLPPTPIIPIPMPRMRGITLARRTVRPMSSVVLPTNESSEKRAPKGNSEPDPQSTVAECSQVEFETDVEGLLSTIPPIFITDPSICVFTTPIQNLQELFSAGGRLQKPSSSQQPFGEWLISVVCISNKSGVRIYRQPLSNSPVQLQPSLDEGCVQQAILPSLEAMAMDTSGGGISEGPTACVLGNQNLSHNPQTKTQTTDEASESKGEIPVQEVIPTHGEGVTAPSTPEEQAMFSEDRFSSDSSQYSDSECSSYESSRPASPQNISGENTDQGELSASSTSSPRQGLVRYPRKHTLDIPYCWNCWARDHKSYECKDPYRSTKQREQLRVAKRAFSQSWNRYLNRIGLEAAIIEVEGSAPDDWIHRIQQTDTRHQLENGDLCSGSYSGKGWTPVRTSAHVSNSFMESSALGMSKREIAEDDGDHTDSSSEPSSEVAVELPDDHVQRGGEDIDTLSTEMPSEQTTFEDPASSVSGTQAEPETREVREVFTDFHTKSLDPTIKLGQIPTTSVNNQSFLATKGISVSNVEATVSMQNQPVAPYASIFNRPTSPKPLSLGTALIDAHEVNHASEDDHPCKIPGKIADCAVDDGIAGTSADSEPESKSSLGKFSGKVTDKNSLSNNISASTSDAARLREIYSLTPPPANGQFIFVDCQPPIEVDPEAGPSRASPRDLRRTKIPGKPYLHISNIVADSPKQQFTDLIGSPSLATPTRRRRGCGKNFPIKPHSPQGINKLPAELLHSIIEYVALEGIYGNPRYEPTVEERSRHERIRAYNLRNLRFVNKHWYEVSQKMIYTFVNFADLNRLAKFVQSITYSRTAVAELVLGLSIEVTQMEPHENWRKYMRPRHQFEKPEGQFEKDIEPRRLIKLMRTVLERCVNLREFIAKCNGAIRLFDSLDAHYPSITKLHVYDKVDKGACAQNTWQVMQRCPNLQDFSLVRPESNRLYDYKAMQIVPIRDIYSSFNFQRLTSLHFEFAAEVSDKILRCICSQLPELKKLHINECKLVTASGLAKVIENMKQRLTQFSYTSHIDTRGCTTKEETRKPEWHLCKMLNECPLLEILYYAPYRCCSELFEDAKWPNLRILKIGMVEYHGCHGEKDDSALQAAFKDLVDSRKCPLIISNHLKYQTNTPGVTYRR